MFRREGSRYLNFVTLILVILLLDRTNRQEMMDQSFPNLVKPLRNCSLMTFNTFGSLPSSLQGATWVRPEGDITLYHPTFLFCSFSPEFVRTSTRKKKNALFIRMTRQGEKTAQSKQIHCIIEQKKGGIGVHMLQKITVVACGGGVNC